MNYVPVSGENRADVTAFLVSRWFTVEMVLHGRVVDLTQVEGIVGYEDSNIAALLTYLISGDTCEIISLDSLTERQGIATGLIHLAAANAREKGCKKLLVTTTNDNLGAIRFYQKRGFDMARLYRNAVNESRKLKPEIPLTGENGIPLRHEIEFEYDLTCQDRKTCF